MHIPESPAQSRPKPLTTVQRWLALIDQQGGQNAALVTLFRQVDELERIKRAVRALGLSPEILASEAHGATL